MKRSVILLWLICIFSFFLVAQPHYTESKSTYYPGQLLVMLKPGCRPGQLVAKFPYLRDTQSVSREWNIWKVSFDVTADAEMVKKEVAANEVVLIAQYNHNSIPLKTVPNDTLFSDQWDMTKISAPQAWDLVTGGITSDTQQVVVATIDQSFDITHPDIGWWKNTAEIPGNGIDDDGNGYIDDYNGWNVMFNNDSFPPLNHGTFVAGISGALGNNTMGVSGVCWNVKEMVVGTNTDNEASVVSAYSYVFKQRQLYNTTAGVKGAFVVATNSSFGPAGYGVDYPLWNAMYDSLGHMGILSAGATSNTASCNTDTCPDIPSQCASDFTIIVTGTTSADVRHGGYGPHNVDIAAPGNGTYTTLLGGTYGTCGGTSAASPHVAGAIALMWSAACPEMLADYRNHPDSMALLMKQYLLESVDTLPALIGMIVSGGRLNVYKAVQRVKAYNCTPDTTVVTTAISTPIDKQSSISVYPNPVTEKLSIQSVFPVSSVMVYNTLGQMVGRYTGVIEIDLSKLKCGVYAVYILDSHGNCVVRSVVKE